MSDKNIQRIGAVIKVIGVGGGGCNAINYMIESGLQGVEFISANTDAQTLANCTGSHVIQIGANMTKGLGAGTNPEVGRAAAMEDRGAIEEALMGTDMVFITTGMGGGTGTGAAPVIAEIAKDMGILTVAVVTRPFPFEGKRRMKQADEGIRALQSSVDSLITIPNEMLMLLLGKDVALKAAFAKADDVLHSAVRGISDIINCPGLMNVDFADVKAVMSQNGMALMGTGFASGEDRARIATESAIRNPLLANVNLMGARGILVNITAGNDLSLGEFTEVGDIIEEFASENAIVKVGTVFDPSVGDDLHVTVVATGLDQAEAIRPEVDNFSRQQAAPSRPVHHEVDQYAVANLEERHHYNSRPNSMDNAHHNRGHQVNHRSNQQETQPATNMSRTHSGHQQVTSAPSSHRQPVNAHRNNEPAMHSHQSRRQEPAPAHNHGRNSHEDDGYQVAAFSNNSFNDVPDITRPAAVEEDFLNIPAFTATVVSEAERKAVSKTAP